MKYLFALITILIACSCQTDVELAEALRPRLDQMESGIREGKPELVASVYSDEAYLANAQQIHAQGRQAVDRYWQELASVSTNWELKGIDENYDLEKLIQSDAWQNLGEQAPPTPDDLLIDISGLDHPVFQLGRSDLTINHQGKEHIATVYFLLVWTREADTWRIAVDLYK